MAGVVVDINSNFPADVAGIIEDIQQLPPRAGFPGPKCGVSVALERIAAVDAAVAAQVAERVDNEKIPAGGVADVLTSRTGFPVSAFTVRRHRKRARSADGCRCPK